VEEFLKKYDIRMTIDNTREALAGVKQSCMKKFGKGFALELLILIILIL
jgi:hypothetical protein